MGAFSRLLRILVVDPGVVKTCEDDATASQWSSEGCWSPRGRSPAAPPPGLSPTPGGLGPPNALGVGAAHANGEVGSTARAVASAKRQRGLEGRHCCRSCVHDAAEHGMACSPVACLQPRSGMGTLEAVVGQKSPSQRSASGTFGGSSADHRPRVAIGSCACADPSDSVDEVSLRPASGQPTGGDTTRSRIENSDRDFERFRSEGALLGTILARVFG